uniref:Uncharacterized protein n=1 Tax=Nicotiana tabacum TaxID=4097 RepID=A0A1S4CQ27_TOBAC|nr:PREDICTED: uncharacterized protein LOC107821257 [Nicotiana tabacum]
MRVLVDPGSSSNIIHWRVLEQVKLIGNIIPVTKLLASFNLKSMTTRGEILIPTHVEGVTKTTMFEVVDGNMSYNVILGGPWIHKMKVVPSTYWRRWMQPIDHRRDRESGSVRGVFGKKVTIDMTGIPLEVAGQKLSFDPIFPPVRQKKRPIVEVRNMFVKEEATRLLIIGSIREVRRGNLLDPGVLLGACQIRPGAPLPAFIVRSQESSSTFVVE